MRIRMVEDVCRGEDLEEWRGPKALLGVTQVSLPGALRHRWPGA